ncbi:hypothetical protein GCM10009850_114390 [Nonomuraea monospora]|uniref:Uncharacterized protein n=1 Tax=Nonomuraea monospora TaxID=568818 RepID=A0ABP5PW57_9ACTN
MVGEGSGDLGCFVVDGLSCGEDWAVFGRAAAAAGAGGASEAGDEEGFGVEAVVRAGESLPMAAQAVVEAAATTAAPAATVVQRRRFEVALRCEPDGSRGSWGDGLRVCWPKVNHGPR